jgi:hypothetical protein
LSDDVFTATQIYDPVTNTWTAGPDLPAASQFADQGLVSDGSQLLVAGGLSPGIGLITSVQHLAEVPGLTSATVAITGGTFAGDGDVLAATTAGTNITAAYNSTTETLTLTGTDTLADYTRVLESVTFQTNSLNPLDFGFAPTRTLTWTVNDGTTAGFSSATQTTTVTVTAINHPPTLDIAATTSFTEKAGPVSLATGATVRDPDNLNLVSATVAIAAGGFAGDVLAAKTAGTSITASYNSATETLLLSGTDTFADYQSVIDSVTFNSTSLNPTDYGSDPSRLVVWTINEGSGPGDATASTTTTIGVTAVNDPPTLTSVAATDTLALKQTITVSPHLTVSDPDNLTLASATVAITGGFAGDGDVLAATATGNITVSYNSASETLTLMGSDTLADYTRVLDSVTFSSGPNPGRSGLDPTRTLTWTVNDGAASNTPSVTTTISVPSAIKNDFNGDGTSDIVFQDTSPPTSGGSGRGRGTTDPTAGDAMIQLVSNGTVASEMVLPGPGSGWHIVGSGDFNGDGNTDLVFQNTNGTPVIWTMNGTQITSSTTLTNPGSSWTAAAIGDFNGDGNPDILFQNVDGTPMIYTMNGTSVSATTLLPDPGASWHVAATGDFNGDGKSDIVFQNTDGTPQVWLMNGTSITASASLTDPGSSWKLVGTADFNHDGKADLLFQNTSTGAPMIWTMNGTSVTSQTTLAPATGLTLIGAGEYNGGNQPELLFQNAAGAPVVWAMNGTSVTGATTLTSPGGNGWHANAG